MGRWANTVNPAVRKSFKRGQGVGRGTREGRADRHGCCVRPLFSGPGSHSWRTSRGNCSLWTGLLRAAVSSLDALAPHSLGADMYPSGYSEAQSGGPLVRRNLGPQKAAWSQASPPVTSLLLR